VDNFSQFIAGIRMRPEVPPCCVSDPVGVHEMISRIRDRGYVNLSTGENRMVTGAVSLQDAMRLSSTVYTNKCMVTLETGVAFGFSTLAIKAAQKKLGVPSHHYAVDPDQFSTHKGSAIALLEEYGISDGCEVLPSPAHVYLPELLERGIVLDFAFIDGWHTFDYTLLDFFYIDKMLKPGGIVAIHDCTWPAVQKVIRFINTHRQYELLPFPRVTALRSAYRIYKSVLRRDSSIMFSLKRTPNLLFFRKAATWEPRWDYFKSF